MYRPLPWPSTKERGISIMSRINTEKLRKAIQHYKFVSKPSNGNPSATCSIADVEKVIKNTAALFEQFIEELEK